MEVVGLWRHPVKSLQGERLEVADLEGDGVVGDRRWGLRDQRTGRILTARRRPELLGASARYDGDTPVITLPEGDTVTGPGPATDLRLSQWLASPVSLVRSLDHAPGRAEFFEDPTDDTSATVEWTMPQGRFVDAAPVLVLTTASLRTAARHYPAGVWDPRRFRANVVVGLEGEGWVEDSWVGQQLTLAAVTLVPTQPCVRCTMVTRPQPGLEADVDIFRTLARNHGGLFGVWCDVAVAGRLSVGDRGSLPSAVS